MHSYAPFYNVILVNVYTICAFYTCNAEKSYVVVVAVVVAVVVVVVVA